MISRNSLTGIVLATALACTAGGATLVAEDLAGSGVVALRAGRYDEAARLLRRRLEQVPGEPCEPTRRRSLSTVRGV